ncbi:MAG: RidA family protein [Saprospiraceae bacterium]|nr:RidA family protein [Saprospiraceae bacterium]
MKSFPIIITLLIFCLQSISGQSETHPEERLKMAGFTLPEAKKPIANFVTSVRDGNKLYLSGHGYCGEPTAVDKGKLGKDLSVEQGYQAAKNVGLCMLATVKHAVGDLSKVKRIIRVFGMVNSTEDFVQQPLVMNGFSDLMVLAFGENGKHVRSAVGMAQLPGGMSVEVEMMLEIEEQNK